MDIDAALDEELQAAEAWVPAAGDKLVGVVTATGSRDGGYGEYPILVVESDKGDLAAIHAYHTVLKDKIAEQSPQVGERVGVKYVGKVSAKNGNTYDSYRLIVDRGNAELSRATHPSSASTDEEPF